jgi:signal transduction histidine kinase
MTRGWRSWAFDVAVALAATGFEVAQVYSFDRTAPVAAVCLAVVAGGIVVLRRRAPLQVFAVSVAAVVGIAIAGVSPAGVGPLVALYTVAVTQERRVSIPAVAVGATVATLLPLAGPSENQIFDPIAAFVCSVGAWGVGVYIETRRRYRRELQERAAYLEREREQLARIAAHEERASIARELHDIVAHSVSVMLVGVRGARDVLRTSPDVADETLANVETSGEQSLAELRRILALLREPKRTAESRPQPSLAELDELVAAFRDAGMPVRLEIVGERQRLPDGVELSVYRIVQEALTNVLKHSYPTRVTVTLAFHDQGLEVEVVDDGLPKGDGAVATGHGIVGMRERVALLGGELETGRRADGGFQVVARLPVEGAA